MTEYIVLGKEIVEEVEWKYKEKKEQWNMPDYEELIYIF